MFLRLDLQMLINQFEDFAPAAIQQYKLMDVNANWLLAWQSAVAHVQERRDLTIRHPHDVLGATLQRGLAWSGCTTSGVEQTFGLSEWLVPKRRGRLGTERQEDELILHADKKDHDR